MDLRFLLRLLHPASLLGPFGWTVAARLALILALVPGPELLPAKPQAPAPPASGTASHIAPNPAAKLTFRVYNYAHLDANSLARSEAVANAIFSRLGIPTLWLDCAVTNASAGKRVPCASEMGTTDLVLRILPHHMAVRLPHRADSLGFAQICTETEPACELSAFQQRIDDLATSGYRSDLILGYVIAHEVAHVLIGPGHSEQGIMRGEWSPADLQRISWGMPLNFTSDQSRQLQRAVLRRTMPPTLTLRLRAGLSSQER